MDKTGNTGYDLEIRSLDRRVQFSLLSAGATFRLCYYIHEIIEDLEVALLRKH